MPSSRLPLPFGKLYLVLTTLFLIAPHLTGSSSPSDDGYIMNSASSSLSSDSSSSSIPSSIMSKSQPSLMESSNPLQYNSPVAAVNSLSKESTVSSGIRNSNINKRSASTSSSSSRHASNNAIFRGDAIIESETLTPGTTSMSVFEGDAIILTCKVKSNVSDDVIIQWQAQTEDKSEEPVEIVSYMSDAIVNLTTSTVNIATDPIKSALEANSNGDQSQQQQQQQQSLLKITESQLYIKSATYSHRAHYICMVDRTSSTSQPLRVLVRVKDRLAALWPFIGILGEVITLCTVIFVYESKRTKAEEEDLNADPLPSPTRDAPGHSSSTGK